MEKQYLHSGNVDMKLLEFFGVPEEDYKAGITYLTFNIQMGYFVTTEYGVYKQDSQEIVKKFIEYSPDMKPVRRWGTE